MDGAMHNGVGVHGTGKANGQPAETPPNLRIPTVHEALPYSPFSSIIPFSPGRLIPRSRALLTVPTPPDLIIRHALQRQQLTHCHS